MLVLLWTKIGTKMGKAMPSLSIKNVPEEVVASLRHRAKRNHRSLQGQLLAILEAAVGPRSLTVAEVSQQVQALGVSTVPESTEMVREDRDAR